MMPAAVVVSRIAAAVLGGYAATAASVTLLAALLPRLTPLGAADAVVLTTMCGFPAYLLALLWGFSHASVARVWLVLGGTGITSAMAVMALAAGARAA
ncbi:MAG: iron transporter [Zoogloeaceae bacterium]|nr:iron transporter [Zoogloeaceae bacterium]